MAVDNLEKAMGVGKEMLTLIAATHSTAAQSE